MKTASRLIDLISKKKKKQIALAARFFVFLNAVLCDLNVKRPRYALFLWRSCRMCILTQYFFFLVFMFAFIFHCRSFSPCWPQAFLIFSPPLWIPMFFFLRNSSPLFSITRSSSFSVIHVSVNIKNNAEKDTTLLLFFLSKSPGGHVISIQTKASVSFGLPYLLIELFYIGMPMVRTVARSVYGHVITKFSRTGKLPHFLSYGELSN